MTPIRDAAAAFLHSLGAAQADRLRAELDDPGFRDWTYLPGNRPGLLVADLSDEQRILLWQLLELSQGVVGRELVMGAMDTERVRREQAGGRPVTDDKYWLRVHGRPELEAGSGDAWAWRMNGHHIGLHVVSGPDRTTYTPHFIGAEPAEVRQGPRSGLRILAAEEDLARSLLTSLDADQRSAALVAPHPPADILTRADPVADPSVLPSGLTYDRMNDAQRDLGVRLIRRYLDRAPSDYAEARMAVVLEAPGEVAFAWAGGQQRGERHYYCVRGPGFLIEYDNTQDGGNHAHSVWRDLRDDFGGDLLAAHYRLHHR